MWIRETERPVLFAVHHRGVVNQGHIHQNFVFQENFGETFVEGIVDGGLQFAQHVDDPVLLLEDLFSGDLAVLNIFLPALVVIQKAFSQKV